jgi:hypothetical protein
MGGGECFFYFVDEGDSIRADRQRWEEKGKDAGVDTPVSRMLLRRVLDLEKRRK